jgi:hypothetical protein
MQMAVTRRTWKEPDLLPTPDERISVESAIPGCTAGRFSAPKRRPLRFARGANAGNRWPA